MNQDMKKKAFLKMGKRKAFGGNIVTNNNKSLVVVPRDSMRRRVYVGPLGLWLTLDSGTFSAIEITKKSGTVNVSFNEDRQGSVARLRIEQPARVPGVGTFRPVGHLKLESI